MEHIQHPEITWAERTGYPSWNQPKDDEEIYCEECGKDITHRDVYYDEHHKHLCKDCLLFFHILDY
jgi:hypothetical protein